MNENKFARLMLYIMVLDLGYTYEPTYGHFPLRHQVLWKELKEYFGKEFDEKVQSILQEREKGKNGFGTFPAADVIYGSCIFDSQAQRINEAMKTDLVCSGRRE